MINELFFDKSIKSSEYIQYHTHLDNFVHTIIHQPQYICKLLIILSAIQQMVSM